MGWAKHKEYTYAPAVAIVGFRCMRKLEVMERAFARLELYVNCTGFLNSPTIHATDWKDVAADLCVFQLFLRQWLRHLVPLKLQQKHGGAEPESPADTKDRDVLCS